MPFKSDKQRKFVMAKLTTANLSGIRFIHSTDKKYVHKIRPTKNPNIIKGIYTVLREENGKWAVKFFPKRCQVGLITKDNVKVADLGTQRPIMAYTGYGNKNYKQFYNQIKGKLTPNQILDIDKKRKVFVRRFNQEIKKRKIDVIRNAGDWIITNPKIIKKQIVLRCPQ